MSEFPESPVRVIPGAGAVMRYGATTLVVLGAMPPVLRQLREAVHAAAGHPDASEAIARAMEVVRADGARAAALVVEGETPAVLISGDVDVCAVFPAGELRLNGGRLDEVVRQPLHGTFSTVVIGATVDGDVDAETWWELTEGSVPGAGATIDLGASLAAAAAALVVDADGEPPRSEGPEDGDAEHIAQPTMPVPRLDLVEPPAADPEPDPASPEPAVGPDTASEPPMFRPAGPPTTESVALPPPPGHEARESGASEATPSADREHSGDPVGRPADVGEAHDADAPFESVMLGGARAPADAEAEPRGPLADRVEAETSAAPTVQGLNCSRGHFNHPLSANCAWCGIGMAQASHVLVVGERPPLGVLVVNGQATLTLDTGYVIGRQPSLDDSVDGVTVRELLLADDQRSISRIHAEIRLDGWEVLVDDRGSGIGTWVLPMEGPRVPTRVESGHPRRLRSGDQVLIGPHQVTFHSHHLR